MLVTTCFKLGLRIYQEIHYYETCYDLRIPLSFLSDPVHFA